MKQKWSVGKVVILVLLSIGAGILIGYSEDKPEIKEVRSSIPPRPDNNEVMYFDFQTNEWKYVYQTSRAKGEIGTGMTKEELEDHLEKHVDGYLEDNYWGEEQDY